MKVYVTQGHEEGIGLEVFLKSCLMLSNFKLNQIQLISTKNAVRKTLSLLRIPFIISDHSVSIGPTNISCHWFEPQGEQESFKALRIGIEFAEKKGVLFTLPTSKDQFPDGLAGHTEYFRHLYRNPHLGMFFCSDNLRVLLLTDHIPLNQVPGVLNEDYIVNQLNASLSYINTHFQKIDAAYISGINPHCGEMGLLGFEDEHIVKALRRIKNKLNIKIHGPYSGDTLFFEKNGANDLLIYMYHDQGLGVFKSQMGFIGSNITLGLPFPRISPDHGTSFKLYGKNVADYRGCEYSLNQAVSLLGKITHGKNSSY
jgi:4-hydroxythreonine-4-phosphate dehydrogenase